MWQEHAGEPLLNTAAANGCIHQASGDGVVGRGEWASIPSVAVVAGGEVPLTVNVGDYLSLLSGGRLLSPRHRVTMPASFSSGKTSDPECASSADGSRTSMVFFAYPPYETRLSFGETAAVEARYQRRLLQTSLLQQQEEGASSGCGEGEDTVVAAVAAVQQQPFGEFISRKWGQVARL